MEPQTLEELLSWDAPPLQAILGDGLLYKNSKAILYGRYKAFKSMLAKHFGLSLAAGRPWLGFPSRNGGASVLYLQLEIPHRLLKSRVEGLEVPLRPFASQIWFWTEHYLKLDTPKGIARLEKQLSNLKPTVLIVDPIYKVLSGNITEPHSVQVFLDYMDLMIERHDLTLVLISHTRKGVVEDEWGSDDMFGSAMFSWWADTIIKVSRMGTTGGDDRLDLSFDVVRHAQNLIPVREVVFNREHMTFETVQAKPRLVKSGG